MELVSFEIAALFHLHEGKKCGNFKNKHRFRLVKGVVLALNETATESEIFYSFFKSQFLVHSQVCA